jgi:hypothetical protein
MVAHYLVGRKVDSIVGWPDDCVSHGLMSCLAVIYMVVVAFAELLVLVCMGACGGRWSAHLH